MEQLYTASLTLIEDLGDGQMMFQLPTNVVLGSSAVGGRVGITFPNEDYTVADELLLYRIVDVAPTGDQVILGPLDISVLEQT